MNKTYTKIAHRGKDNYFFLSNGKDIIYCERNPHSETFKISSVHKPSRECGTGYQLEEYATLTVELIEKLLPVAFPQWAKEQDFKYVIKYDSLNEWLNYEKKFFNDLEISEITY